jgi:hypothetical protein
VAAGGPGRGRETEPPAGRGGGGGSPGRRERGAWPLDSPRHHRVLKNYSRHFHSPPGPARGFAGSALARIGHLGHFPAKPPMGGGPSWSLIYDGKCTSLPAGAPGRDQPARSQIVRGGGVAGGPVGAVGRAWRMPIGVLVHLMNPRPAVATFWCPRRGLCLGAWAPEVPAVPRAPSLQPATRPQPHTPHAQFRGLAGCVNRWNCWACPHPLHAWRRGGTPGPWRLSPSARTSRPRLRAAARRATAPPPDRRAPPAAVPRAPRRPTGGRQLATRRQL